MRRECLTHRVTAPKQILICLVFMPALFQKGMLRTAHPSLCPLPRLLPPSLPPPSLPPPSFPQVRRVSQNCVMCLLEERGSKGVYRWFVAIGRLIPQLSSSPSPLPLSLSPSLSSLPLLPSSLSLPGLRPPLMLFHCVFVCLPGLSRKTINDSIIPSLTRCAVAAALSHDCALPQQGWKL